jgi:tetratricopeptide (TPR) repeat protein
VPSGLLVSDGSDGASSGRPPGRPFPPGVSGNRKGRPKGALNEADILARYLKKTRGKGKSRTTVAEAIIRKQFLNAAGGNQAAQKLIFDLREKIAGQEVTAEERERRTVVFPRPSTEDEYDLWIVPARELERQECKAVLDRKDPIGRGVPDLIMSGDKACDERRFEAAMHSYAEQVRSAAPVDVPPHLVGPPPDDPHYRGVARLGCLANQLLWARQYQAAIECADVAVAAAGTRDVTWIKLIAAHAAMFLGRIDEARAFYGGFHGDKRQFITHWETRILRDFADFRNAGLSVPLMSEVEATLLEAGWSVDFLARRGRSVQKEMEEGERDYLRLNPHTDEAALIYKKHGMLAEAADVHRRQMQKAKFALEQQTDDDWVTALLTRSELQLAQLARDALIGGNFGLGLEIVHELSPGVRAGLPLQAVLAHLLLLTGKTEAAEEIYLRHCGKLVGDRPWSAVMLDDLQSIRAKGLSTAASKRWEAYFEENPDLSSQGQIVPRAPSYRSRAEAAPAPAQLADRSDNQAGQELFGLGQYDEAATVFARVLEALGAHFADGRPGTGQHRQDRQSAVDGLADIALILVCEGRPNEAVALCQTGLDALPNALWPALRQAHALVALKRPEEARPIYMRSVTGKTAPKETWPAQLEQELEQLRGYLGDPPILSDIITALQHRKGSLPFGSVIR